MLACFLFCTQGCGRIERPVFPAPSFQREPDQSSNLAQKNLRRDREAVHGDLPSLHAPLRVAGSEASKARSRGWGWGVLQQVQCQHESDNRAGTSASVFAAPPPTPTSRA